MVSTTLAEFEKTVVHADAPTRARKSQPARSTTEQETMKAGAPRALRGATLPSALRDLPDPPQQMFVHGELPPGPCIGIVGTRHPTPEARAYAVQLSARLAERGVAIVSGGAEGIDAAAHEGALQVGGTTLVVAPSSFDCPFPAEHRGLFERIVETGGAYLSAYEANVQARPDRFLLRNSYLVALSLALVVVEAPIRSGARNAAKWARRLRRGFFVVPAVPWNPLGEGSIAELRLGGRPLASHSDVLRWLEQREQHPVATRAAAAAAPSEEGERRALPSAPPREQPRRRAKRAHPAPAKAGVAALGDPALDSIVAAVRSGCHTADEIGQSANLGAAAVSHGLLLLTLQGVIVQTGGDVRLVD